jgi:hypothetical protein
LKPSRLRWLVDMTNKRASAADADKAKRAVKRAVGLARTSAFVMIFLGGLFALIGIMHPLSPGFLVSVAVFVNGIIEWRGARALRAFDMEAPDRLAINQVALGIELVVYAMWQTKVLSPEVLDAMLRGPLVAPVLEMYPPDMVIMLEEILPQLVRLFYFLVAVVAVIGCGATALYYRSRSRFLSAARTTLPPELPRLQG